MGPVMSDHHHVNEYLFVSNIKVRLNLGEVTAITNLTFFSVLINITSCLTDSKIRKRGPSGKHGQSRDSDNEKRRL